ncbi:hypothetical protein HOY80DRAFT_940893 [Tuber brumale]|nr:hypothetical protein HOY80DRAFT_940893 [Tuber brumale]
MYCCAVLFPSVRRLLTLGASSHNTLGDPMTSRYERLVSSLGILWGSATTYSILSDRKLRRSQTERHFRNKQKTNRVKGKKQ